MSSLGSWRSSIELHPQHDFRFSDADLRFASPRFDLNYETHQLRTFRKRALRAIGRVAQTKILVNLQKALLTGESPQKFSLPRIIGEKSCRGDSHRLIGESRAQLAIIAPDLALISEGERVNNVESFPFHSTRARGMSRWDIAHWKDLFTGAS